MVTRYDMHLLGDVFFYRLTQAAESSSQRIREHLIAEAQGMLIGARALAVITWEECAFWTRHDFMTEP